MKDVMAGRKGNIERVATAFSVAVWSVDISMAGTNMSNYLDTNRNDG